jgi:hypothetical protein
MCEPKRLSPQKQKTRASRRNPFWEVDEYGQEIYYSARDVLNTPPRELSDESAYVLNPTTLNQFQVDEKRPNRKRGHHLTLPSGDGKLLLIRSSASRHGGGDLGGPRTIQFLPVIGIKDGPNMDLDRDGGYRPARPRHQSRQSTCTTCRLSGQVDSRTLGRFPGFILWSHCKSCPMDALTYQCSLASERCQFSSLARQAQL